MAHLSEVVLPENSIFSTFSNFFSIFVPFWSIEVFFWLLSIIYFIITSYLFTTSDLSGDYLGSWDSVIWDFRDFCSHELPRLMVGGGVKVPHTYMRNRVGSSPPNIEIFVLKDKNISKISFYFYFHREF